jgi:hypothetical protein
MRYSNNLIEAMPKCEAISSAVTYVSDTKQPLLHLL